MSCPWTPGKTEPTTPLYTSNKPPTLTVTGLHHFFPRISHTYQLSLLQTKKLFDILLYQFKQLLLGREFFCFNPHDETVVKWDFKKKYQNGQKKVKNLQNHRWYPLVN